MCTTNWATYAEHDLMAELQVDPTEDGGSRVTLNLYRASTGDHLRKLGAVLLGKRAMPDPDQERMFD